MGHSVVSLMMKSAVVAMACTLGALGFSKAHADGASPKVGRTLTTVAVCGIAFELPSGYRVTRASRSKALAGKSECRFEVLMVNPKNPDLDECHSEGDYPSQPPYDVCDWYLAGPLDPGVAASIVVGRGRLDADQPDDIGVFSFEDGAWRLPDVGGAHAALVQQKFFGRRALAGTWVSHGAWIRRWTKNSNSVTAGTFDVPGALLQLEPDTLLGILGDGSDSSEPASLCNSGFCMSLRVATDADLKRH
ncbi:hypothetical protein ACQ858_06125 [Variovorax ureilyticus]|uniref:hypothetical protein n=1 Tax=Variovorax ureilyticus TaxID=1836198 RepID=UPI003D67F386